MKNSSKKITSFHLEILDVKRRQMLTSLAFLKDSFHFYLAGGTALALQLGHRTSLDFDFYSQEEFSEKHLLPHFDKYFRRPQWTLIQSGQGTLIINVREIELSFFYYGYNMLRPCVEVEGVLLASKEDIAAMKLIAIIQRGNMRDFIDMYFLLKEFSLEKIFEYTKKKFPSFNIYLGLRALVYFDEAGEPKNQRFQLLMPISWDIIQEEITTKVCQFKKRVLKG
ncbi:MAG: nucleotidyl transferase AbiEii/AbiGii toxin family protein [Chlamydiae bacterium]|nr:nucleotidyl transferase AbiEii/AbiGii toxin family protein [Chlamydiota bacterium]